MAELPDDQNSQSPIVYKKKKDNYFLHIGLLFATIITTIFAGAQWTTGIMTGPYEFSMLKSGLLYSAAIIFIISCHEFGHYFAARYHKVDATLPFYIPFPPIPLFLNFGTMGAVIKTRSPVTSKKAMFDIGIAGPLAGFVACLLFLKVHIYFKITVLSANVRNLPLSSFVRRLVWDVYYCYEYDPGGSVGWRSDVCSSDQIGRAH